MAAKKKKSKPKVEKKVKKIKGPEKAGFVIRAAAFIVDILLFALFWGVVTAYIGINARTNNDPFYVFLLLSALVVGIFQTTPGKRIFNLKVVRTDSSRVSMIRAVIREGLGKFISSIVFGLGFLWMIVDKQNQALHDKIANTFVVVNKPVGNIRKVLAYLLIIAVLFVFVSVLVIAYLIRRII